MLTGNVRLKRLWWNHSCHRFVVLWIYQQKQFVLLSKLFLYVKRVHFLSIQTSHPPKWSKLCLKTFSLIKAKYTDCIPKRFHLHHSVKLLNPLNHMYLQNPSNPFVPTRPSNLCVGQDLQTHVYLQALRELYIAFRGVTTHISLEEHTSLLQVPQTTMRRKWPQMSLDISSSISPKDPSAYWSSIWHCSSAGVYDQLAVWQV